MSNDSINPWQQFLDFAGRENARGTIEFFTDASRTTAKDIFTTADLSTPQTNPYTLDESGRIRGDVHYTGTATLVHRDRNGYEFRQDNTVTVSQDGLAGAQTIDAASVAAMIANRGLAVGNVVRTRGYYAPNLYGGARYLIVASGTGAVDAYRFIQLGNGLQAQLLEPEANNNFLVAGARGDGGSDDTAAMQACIDQGGDIIVEGGFVFVATNLTISRNCRFFGTGTMKQRNGAAGDFLQIVSTDVDLVKFRDVTLDGNAAAVDPNNATVGWIIPA